MSHSRRILAQGGRHRQPLELLAQSLLLGLQPAGQIAQSADDQLTALMLDGTQADIHRELAAIATNRLQAQATPHGAVRGSDRILLAQPGVPLAGGSRDQLLDREPRQLAGAIAQQALGLGVGEQNRAAGVDEQDGIGKSLEQTEQAVRLWSNCWPSPA